MNKTTRILFVTFAVLLVIHVGLSVAFSYEVYDATAAIRRQQTRDMLSLQARIEKAEDVIQSSIQEAESQVLLSCPCNEPPCSCAKPEPIETTTAPSVYTLRTYRDIIGVFDPNGQLIHVLNVYCSALPDADQAALEAGIEVASLDEAFHMLEAYS